MAAKEQDVCFIISELDASRRRRKKIQPVWLNKRQMEGLMLIFYNKELPWSGTSAKTWRELKEKRLALKLHKGSRFYHVALSADGTLLADSIDKAAKQAAKPAKKRKVK